MDPIGGLIWAIIFIALSIVVMLALFKIDYDPWRKKDNND